MFSFATILVWATFFVVILYNDKLQKQSAKAMKAESLAKESQLRMLRYQLNPHFMFNSMNSISTLILKKETDKANEMLELLCDFLRYSLETDTEIKTTLKEELKSAELYLQIEKVRFGERLKYEKSVDFGLLKALVPSFFLQPIIENSVKYAIVNNKKGGTICIDVNRVGDNISVCVADHVDVKERKVSPPQPSLGIGLKNIDERLSAIYGNKHQVTMKENEHNGMTVCVSVPIEFGDEYEYQRDQNAFSR